MTNISKLTGPELIRYKKNKGLGNNKFIGPGHIRGYAGLFGTALKISEFIPFSKIYVEPFAGLGRVARYVKADKKILNDMSDYACNYNKRFKALVTQKDFTECIYEWDSEDSFFLIDPPWSYSEYKEGCRDRAFCDRTPKEYYNKLFEILPNLKGNWILCGEKNNSRMKNSEYNKTLVIGKNKIMGSHPKTLLISNKPFIRHNQTTIDK